MFCVKHLCFVLCLCFVFNNCLNKLKVRNAAFSIWYMVRFGYHRCKTSNQIESIRNAHVVLVFMFAQECFAKYGDHVALMQPYDVYTPKHHLMWHVLIRMGYQGNPSFYSNWVDEDLNKKLKACCRNVSQSTFESTVLLKMREVLRRGIKRPA